MEIADNTDSQFHNRNNNNMQNTKSFVVSSCSQICSNCSTQTSTLGNHSQIDNQFDPTSTNFNPILHETEMNVIRMMLSEIYNLHYIPHLKNKSSTSSSIEEYNIDFPLCSSCSTLLADLFNLYSQFNKLRTMDSLLAKEIDVLKSLVKHRESQDLNQNPGQDENGIFVKRDIFNQSPITVNKKATSSKFEFSPNDGPWVKVGPRLEDMAIEEIGYAPPSLCHLYQVPTPPEPNLVISNVFSSQSQITSDNDEENENDLDYEPFPDFGDEPVDVKVFTDPDVTNEDNLSPDIPTKKSTRKRRKTPTKFTVKSKKKKLPPVKNENYNKSNNDREPPAKKQLISKKKSKVDNSNTLPLKKSYKPKTKTSSSSPQKPKSKAKTNNEESQIGTIDNNLDGNDDEFPLNIETEPRLITYDEVVKKKAEEDELLFLKSDKPRKKKTKQRFRTGYEKRQMNGLGCPCLYCLEDFATPEERADHVRDYHCQRKAAWCEICGATFISKHQLTYHLTKSVRKCSARLESTESRYMRKKKAMQNAPIPEKSKEKERNFPCTAVINENGDVCPYRAQNAVILKNHMENVHCDPKEKVKCSECNAVLKNAYYFKLHFLRKHTQKGQSGYNKTKEKAQARKSRRIREENAKGFICYHCNPPINFLTKARWTIHLTKEHNDYGTRKKITVCELCGKKFKGNYALNKHLEFVHADLRPFVCEHCGKSYKSKTNLDTHISRGHTESGKEQYNKYNRENYQRKKLIKQQKERGSTLNNLIESNISLNANVDDQMSLPTANSRPNSLDFQ